MLTLWSKGQSGLEDLFKRIPISLRMFSRGGRSSWCYLRSFNTLFDCGEGCATSLGNHVFGVDRVFLSHNHYDHVAGLLGLLNGRVSFRGDRLKPMKIYTPDAVHTRKFIDLFFSDFTRTSLDLEIIEVQALDSISLAQTGKQVEVFKTRHTSNSVGYAISEKRKRLKPSLRGRIGCEVKRMASEGKTLSETHHASVFCYALDNAGGVPPALMEGALVVQDCTFIMAGDMDRGETHNTLEGNITNLQRMIASGAVLPKLTIFAHISSRYDWGADNTIKMITDNLSKEKLEFLKNLPHVFVGGAFRLG